MMHGPFEWMTNAAFTGLIGLGIGGVLTLLTAIIKSRPSERTLMIDGIKDNMARMDKQIVELQRKNSALETKMDKILQENSELKQDKQDWQEERSVLRDQIKKEKEKNSLLKKENDALKADLRRYIIRGNN